MHNTKAVTIVAGLLVAATPALAQSVWTAPASQKVRPGDAAGSAQAATLEAARNEFEAFHVVVAGGGAGAKAITVTADKLTGPGGATLDDVRVYREGWYNVATPSNVQGAPGRWPDPMIPAVDEIDGQPRNAFPYDVPPNEQQPVWVEYHASATQAAGWYTGAVHVTGGVTADIPVKLYVHAFALPSTSSLPSAYGIGWADACTAHFGGYQQCGGDAGVQSINSKYARLALDHRISLSEAITTGPAANADGSFDWATWDAAFAPMLNGSMQTRLVGAKLTGVRYSWTADQAHVAEWAKHFRDNGWLDRTFDYSCDEPPAGCSWSSINGRTAMVHAAAPDMRTLVTTQMGPATQNGVLGGIDMLVPTIDLLDPMPPASNTRPQYDAWRQQPRKQIWMYQSCESDGCNGVGPAVLSGWPTHMVDAPATQNRAMEWQAWRQKIDGELYYDTTYAFTRGDAWATQYYFGGNGDGTLFYPGTPAKIGGSSQVPIGSLRLKMIREGMEDYEYLKALADAGDPTMADAMAAELSPKAYQNATDPAAIDSVRHRIALRIEALTGQTPPPMNGSAPGSGGNGDTGTTPPQDSTATAPAAPAASSGGGSSGCAMAAGRAPTATPLALVLLAAGVMLVARRRRRARVPARARR